MSETRHKETDDMHVERLLRVADKLQGRGPYVDAGPVPAKKFNMGVWVGAWSKSYHKFRQLAAFFKGEEAGAIDLPGDVPAKERARYILMRHCGSAACACGWAGTDPWFQEQGFYALEDGGIYDRNHSTGGYDAAETFFGLTESDCRQLFSPNLYPRAKAHPDEVANRIRAAVHDHTHAPGYVSHALQAVAVTTHANDPPVSPPETPKRKTGSFAEWADDLAETIRKKEQGE